MNDFFTELDSDLLGAKHITKAPKDPIPFLQKEKIPVRTETHPRKGGEYPTEPRRTEKKQTTVRDAPKKQDTRTVPVHVQENRLQMMDFGVVVIVFRADEKTKALLGHLKLETRGFVYLDEVREAHKVIIKKARASYEDTIQDVPDIEEKDLIKIIRHDLEIFIQHKMERNPVIIPMILYV